MNISLLVIIALAFGIIIGGITLLRKSAKKFHLTPEQAEKVKKRQQELAQQERDEDK